MAIRKSPGMQPTLICTIFPNVGRDQPLCLETIWEETTNSTSNKSWKTLKSVRKMHKKMNNSSKTETNNDMIKLNITEFKTVLLEKVLLKKNPLSTHRKIKKKYGMFLEYFHRFRKKGLTSPTNSCDVLIRYIWGQSSIQLTWDVIMTQKQLYYLCPTIRKISLPKIFRNGQIKTKNSLMKEIHKQIKIIELKERHL